MAIGVFNLLRSKINSENIKPLSRTELKSLLANRLQENCGGCLDDDDDDINYIMTLI